ncbi:Dcp1-like decapping family [Microdochium nivale]|nr:Dcp1-like decapping family [Microdochium nivale]
MSRPAPRKPKAAGGAHVRNRSQHLQAQAHVAQTSDYESDTPYYMGADVPLDLAERSNMSIKDLNLSVLKRYLPSITDVPFHAVNGVVYTLSYSSMEWERGTVEGTVFVCLQGGHPARDLGSNACVVVLNRKGLDNFILDLSTVNSFEFNGELFIFKMDDQDPTNGRPRIYGVWTHFDNDGERAKIGEEINNLWAGVRAARQQRQAAGLEHHQHAHDAQMGPALQALGRRLSLSALFGNGA